MKKIISSLLFFFSFIVQANPVEITEEFSLKKEINGKRIYVSLLKGSQKIGIASGTEFLEYITLGVLNVLEKKDRKNGNGSRLLKEFLAYAQERNKLVLAKVYPMDCNNDLKGLLIFYEKRGAQIINASYIDKEDGIEKAIIAFQKHVTQA